MPVTELLYFSFWNICQWFSSGIGIIAVSVISLHVQKYREVLLSLWHRHGHWRGASHCKALCQSFYVMGNVLSGVLSCTWTGLVWMSSCNHCIVSDLARLLESLPCQLFSSVIRTENQFLHLCKASDLDKLMEPLPCQWSAKLFESFWCQLLESLPSRWFSSAFRIFP